MVTEFINSILPSIEDFGMWGYWIAFFAALFETTIGIGLILPGSTIILLLGTLAARGYLDVGDLVWFAILGAVIGDNINYYLGKKYGAKWLKDGFWIVKVGHIETAKKFMDAHGAKSIFLGRFVPSVKEIVPLIAGSVKMNYRTFMIWNILGAVGWGFQWVFAGYIFGQSLNLAELWLSRAGLFFAFLIIFIAILYGLKWLILNKGKGFLIIAISFWRSIKQALINNEHVLHWMQKHPRGISFLRARFDTSVFTGFPLSILVVAFIYALILFAGIVENLIMTDPIIAADIRIANLFLSLRSDGLTHVFTWITLLGKSQVVLMFIFITTVLLWVWQKKDYILPLFISVAGSELFTYFGKLAFHRPRPEMAIYVEDSFSFPSGHATIAVALFGYLAYLLMRLANSWSKSVNIFFVTIFLIIIIGFSRIYLGEHYVSDVLSGYLVGAMWLIIAISFCEWLKPKISFEQGKSPGNQVKSPVGRVRLITFVLLFIAASFYVVFSMQYHYPLSPAVRKEVVIVATSTDIFTTEQLKYTETLTGEKQEPINYIFLARNDSQLISAIEQAGWVLTDKANLPSFIKAVNALILKSPYPSAPISPSFWNARIQDISFAKVSGVNWLKNAQHIKIWRTQFLQENGNHIYIAMINANEGFKWGVIPKISPDLDTEREKLYQDFSRIGKVEGHLKPQLVQPHIGKNFMGDPFFSDGKAYIISLQ
ncbi:MAG: LssY C-terminal domain-containing protein [Psychromonas sp.]